MRDTPRAATAGSESDRSGGSRGRGAQHVVALEVGRERAVGLGLGDQLGPPGRIGETASFSATGRSRRAFHAGLRSNGVRMRAGRRGRRRHEPCVCGRTLAPWALSSAKLA